MNVKDALDGLLPPGVPAIVRWRILLSLVVGALVFHAITARGWVGDSGFARASEVKVIDEKVDLLIRLQLESRIRTLVAEKCDSKDTQFRRKIQVEIDNLQVEYQTVLGNGRYPTEFCNATN